MRIRKNIATSDEGFLFNPTTGDSFSTNLIGSEIISLLKKDKSPAEISDIICEHYDVDKILFERDLEDFTSLLKEYSILE
ncbi:MAG: PqqD family protein [Paludibacter sp.]|nr:PqqD family protein [Paludibacter sp.]